MDFVDLDRVLDEFEEEEKAALSIVPGEELKPSGYVQFLEKHENQEWQSLNTDMSNHKHNPGNNGLKEPVNVSYDEPYDSYSPTTSLDSLQNKSLSPVLGKGNQLVITGERARGLRDHVETRSKRGTIASKTSEVQTDALTPDSERELSSLPFPKSDIIVEGHENSFKQEDDSSVTKNNQDQNNSPIYASVDSSRLFSSSSNSSSILSVNAASSVQSGFSPSSLSKDTFGQQTNLQTSFPKPDSVVSFQDVNDGDLDESEINMYLNDIEDKNLELVNNSEVNLNVYDSRAHSVQKMSNIPKVNNTLTSNNQDLILNGSESSIHRETDEEENESCLKTDGNITELLQQDQHNAYHSLIYCKTEIEGILEEKKRLSEGTDDGILMKGDNAIYEQLMFGKMEIEGLIQEVVKNQQERTSDDVCDVSLRGTISGDSVMQQSDGCDSKLVNGMHSSSERLSSPARFMEESDRMLAKNSTGDTTCLYTGVGARPKDPSVLKKNRPNSLGLSKVSLDLPSPSKTLDNAAVLMKPERELISQEMINNDSDLGVTRTVKEATQRMNSDNDAVSAVDNSSAPTYYDSYNSTAEHDDDTMMSDLEREAANGSDAVKKMSRPTTLNLPYRPGFDRTSQLDGEDEEPERINVELTDPSELSEEANKLETATAAAPADPAAVTAALEEDGGGPSLPPEAATIAEGDMQQVAQRNLGEVAPFWVPDAEAESCMTCSIKFTLWKRRHHCRACGKVLCAQCCSQKSILRYMDNKEARVCVECYLDLNVAATYEASPRSPNPNNPSEYCSKVPPNQQASNQGGAPPTVMVPTGVLKSSGSIRRGGEPKQVMFSDGIRPGGDLTELDGEDQSRSHRRSGRAARRAAQQQTQNAAKKLKNDSLSRSPSLVPVEGLPPLYIMDGEIGHVEIDEALNQLDYSDDYRMEGGPSISYAVNKNLSVAVKVVNLDCCMNRVCWSFVSRGMSSVGQRELVILLELTEEEAVSPTIKPATDIFHHYHYLYEEALKGYTIHDMGHTILHQSFLGSRDHGGFLYVQPTFQCLSKLTLPEAPFAFGILLQKWEAPWAKVFPIRLLLRLGAEFRYYPCPLISVRNRKPVFFEIGHTIMNLLADFRNFQYSLSQIRGVTIHMEDKKTVISLPRNRYNDIMKVVRSSNEHVMAFGSSFSTVADSHLVCIQNEEGNYQTQAINIQNKPRQVTGASFVVFNGALKTSSGLRAKSSIVEDGVMIQVLPEAMAALKQVLKDMGDHKILCGPVDASEPDEVLEIQWIDNDKAFNIGVKSYIDGMSLEGVESVSVKCTSDFVGPELGIRWTRVYFLRQDSSSASHFDPVDLTRLTEEMAQACCTALVPNLDELRELEQIKIGLRVNLTRDAVGYEIGSKGQGLPEKMLTNLDTSLIPIIHQASEEGMSLELVFHLLD